MPRPMQNGARGSGSMRPPPHAAQLESCLSRIHAQQEDTQALHTTLEEQRQHTVDLELKIAELRASAEAADALIKELHKTAS